MNTYSWVWQMFLELTTFALFETQGIEWWQEDTWHDSFDMLSGR